MGSISHASAALLIIHTSIFFLSVSRLSDFDRTSMINSGQIGANLSLSSAEIAFHFSNEIQDASGEKTERSGSVNPVELSNTTPFLVCLFHWYSWPKISEL